LGATQQELNSLQISVVRKDRLRTLVSKERKSLIDQQKQVEKEQSKLVTELVSNYFTENPDAKCFVTEVEIAKGNPKVRPPFFPSLTLSVRS